MYRQIVADMVDSGLEAWERGEPVTDEAVDMLDSVYWMQTELTEVPPVMEALGECLIAWKAGEPVDAERMREIARALRGEA